MSGVVFTPGGTLVDRAIHFLGAGPADSLTLATSVLGLAGAPRAVADRVVAALLGAHPRVRQLPDARWSLAMRGPDAQPLANLTFAVVDVETTGNLASRGDRMTEIAVATLEEGEAQLLYEQLLDPGCAISPYVRALTGITNEMLAGQPTFAEVADEIAAVLAGRVFVAHNMRFDWAFVAAELRRARALRLEGPRLCTVRLARRLIPGLRHRGLDAVAQYFGIEIENRHRAGGDALATARILTRLLGLADDRGIRTLDELQQLAGRKKARRRRRPAGPTPMEEA